MSWRASSGLRPWIVQRLSAVYLVLFFMYGVWVLLWGDVSTHVKWREWVSCPLNNVLLSLFFVALLAHAWVGARDVLMDYVKPYALRFTVLALTAVGLLGMGVWSMKVLFNVVAL